MTKLIQKKIDEVQILSAPKQSLLERFFAWGLSKPAIAVAFTAIMGWVRKAVAQESEHQWDIAFGTTVDSFQYSRKMIFVIGGVILLILLLLSIFKKLRWRWLFIILGILVVLAVTGLVIDYIDYITVSGETNVIRGRTGLGSLK